MPTIPELQSQIATAKSKAEVASQSIPVTTQRQLRGQMGRPGLEGRDFQRKLRDARSNVKDFQERVSQQEAQVQAFLKTSQGKLQYAKEAGLQGKEVYGRLGKGYAQEVLAIEYNTPYGKVTDNSPKERALARESEFLSKSTPEEIQNYFEPQLQKALAKLPPLNSSEGQKSSNQNITVQSPVGKITFGVSRTADRTTKVKQTEELKDINRAITSFKAQSLVIPKTSQPKETFIPSLNMFGSEGPTGRQGTLNIRPPTITEQFKIDTANEAGSVRGIISKGGEALKFYQSEVVIPVSQSKTFIKTQKKIIVPTSDFLYRGLGGFKVDVIDPVRTDIKSGLSSFREKIVVPTRKAIPQLGDTPIGQIAEAKRFIERQASIDPTKKVIIGAAGRREVVEVGDLSGKGLIGFGSDVFFREIGKEGTRTARQFGASPEGAKTAGLVAKGVVASAALVTPGVFFGFVGSKVAEAEFGAGAFGGPTSAKNYVTSNPLETAFVVGAGIGGALAGPSKGFKLLKSSTLKGGPKVSRTPLPPIALSKRASLQSSVFADDVVEVIYNGQRVKMLASDARRRGLTILGPDSSIVTSRNIKGYLGGAESFAEKSRRAKLLVDSAKGPEGKKKALDLIEKSFGKKFASDFKAQEIDVPMFSTITTPPTTRVGPSEFVGSGFDVSPRTGFGSGFDTPPRVTGATSVFDKDEPSSSFSPSSRDLDFSQIGDQSGQFSQISQTTSKAAQAFDTTTVTSQGFKTKQESGQTNRQRTGQGQSLGTLSALGQPQALQTQQTTTQLQRQTTTQKTQQKTKKTPKKVVFPIPPIPLIQRLKKKADEEPDFFEVFTRKGGKDIKEGAFSTKSGAKKSLRTSLQSSLRASGFVQKKGKKVPLRELGAFGLSFRPSKVDSFRLVQKRGSRLGTRKETSEIQFVRKGNRRSPFGL